MIDFRSPMEKESDVLAALQELKECDEPMFVLRAQDTFATDLVERWANLAEASRCPAGKVLAARAVARAMFEWRTKKLPD